MRKFYMFTTTDAKDRRQELLDFVNKYNKKYASYNSVIRYLKDTRDSNFITSDGFEFEDEYTSPGCCGWWGHGGITKYGKGYHILVNGNLTLGEL